MVRQLGRCLFGVFAVALLISNSGSVCAAEPNGTAALWPVTRVANIECVDVRDIAARYGLKVRKMKAGSVAQLELGTKTRLVFEGHNRDFYFDGLRIFLGQPVVVAKDTLWVAKIDVIKLVDPLFRPTARLAGLPLASPKTIVLDAGHGGSDPGKENITVGINEKTMTLDVVLRLKRILDARGWRVLLTRADDSRLGPDQATDLQRRADFANKQKADIFVSVHFNAVGKDPMRVTGVETYTMAPQFMLSTGDDKKNEMTDKAFPGNQRDIANLLLGERMHRALIEGLKVSDRGFKRGRLLVLRFVECPGVLVECGYLSNDTEARRVANPEYREKIAEALADGIGNYADTITDLRKQAN